VESGKVNFSTASSRILPEMIKTPGASPEQIAQSEGLIQEGDEGQITLWVKLVLDAMPDKVDEYKKGKKGLIGLFVGEVKKASKGKADPQKATAVIRELLD
jgi:aspartyl-tRNA(Asn)/glutamyl-tRNA(Gln) amidotransferase subunit B